MNNQRILIVDDEPQIQTLLRVALQAAFYETLPASTGAEALRLVASAAPDLVILDLGLPDRDGKDVLYDIRQFSKVPVIVLSARDKEKEKIESLDLGADDYVEKPFGIGELLARIRTAARHFSMAQQEIRNTTIGDLSIDIDRRFVTRNGVRVHLTPKEFDLMAFLVRHLGKPLTHQQILTAVWGKAHLEDTQYLRVFIGQLRSKIEENAKKPTLIITEPSIGYRLMGDADIPHSD